MDNYTTPNKTKKIGELFEKYKKHFKAPQNTVIKACAKSIFNVTGFKVDINSISYSVSSKTIVLNISSILKTEIKFKHKEILDDLRRSLREDELPKIIL